jgi:hypothetical protein
VGVCSIQYAQRDAVVSHDGIRPSEGLAHVPTALAITVRIHTSQYLREFCDNKLRIPSVLSCSSGIKIAGTAPGGVATGVDVK